MLARIALVGLFVVACGSVRAGELEQRRQLMSTAAALYEREDFATLDKLLDQARKGRARTDSGLWQVGLLHGGITDSQPAPTDAAEAEAQEARAQRWIKQRPGSIYAPLVRAQVVYNYARALGCGQCHVQVEGDRRALRDAQMARAAKLYLASKARGADDPQWFTGMIWLAHVQGGTEQKIFELLDESVRRESAYYPTWFAVEDHLLANPPIAPQRISQLVDKAVAATAASEGQGMYARMWWYASQRAYGDQLFQLPFVQWDKFDASFRDIMARYPDDWNRNNYAQFACWAKHPERAREVMAGHEPLPQAWESERLFLACVGVSRQT